MPILLAAAFCVGTLDMIFATTFWMLHDVAPVRVMQSVASGLIGRLAYAGGMATAMLGLGLHFLICLVMVLIYNMLALHVHWLLHHPWRAGPLYGLVLYLCMTFVVLPLSAAAAPSTRLDWIVGSVLGHVLLVGLPCALLVRAAHRVTSDVTPAPVPAEADSAGDAKRI